MAALLLLGACSGGTGQATTTVPLAEAFDWLGAIERTTDESRVAIRTEVAAGQLGDGTVIHDFYDLDRVAARSTVEYGGQQQEELLVDGETGWVRLAVPAFANSLPDGVQYVEAATAELVSVGLVNFDHDRAMPLLYALVGAAAMELVHEPDGRVSYSVEIDPALLAVRLPERVVPSFRASIGDLLDESRAASIQALVSLDDEGRIVFLLIKMTPHRPELEKQLLIQLEIGGFGEPVDIDVPDPNTVIHIDDVPSLSRALATGISTLRRSERP